MPMDTLAVLYRKDSKIPESRGLQKIANQVPAQLSKNKINNKIIFLFYEKRYL